MPTSGLRIVVLVAFVASGLLLIDRGFAGAGGEMTALPTAGPTEPAATSTPTPSATPTSVDQAPTFDGVRLKVNNGTATLGLAAGTTQKLQQRYPGMLEEDAGDVSDVATTTIYYAQGMEDRARWMATDFFGTLAGITVDLQPLDATSPDYNRLDIVIYLGSDYATTDYVKNVLGLE